MSSLPSLRVAIASEQAIFLRGLSALAASVPGVQIVGEAANATDAAQLCDLTQPDIVLLDLRGGGPTCLEKARQMRQSRTDLKIVLMLDSQDEISVDYEEPDVFILSREVTEEEFRTALNLVRTGSFTPGDGQHTPRPEELETAGPYSSLVRDPMDRRNSELVARELVDAGKIQADIMQAEPPVIPGWDVAAALLPARETSGDFYDFIPLTPNKWGVVTADVTDKGMGAALLMALASTLVRTYAPRYPTLPALTLGSVSERILSDTRGGMFVTAFFGILETHTGRFTYANGGHPPGYLVSLRRGRESLERLTRTGMALGVSEETSWKQKQVRIEPGDALVLYTDGITEATNPTGKAYGEDRLLEVLLAKAISPATRIRDAILEEVHRFVGNRPRQDDIALLVIKRKGDSSTAFSNRPFSRLPV
jgi:serine phosphatase RsbU (regulator of sigma subunit)